MVLKILFVFITAGKIIFRFNIYFLMFNIMHIMRMCNLFKTGLTLNNLYGKQ